MTFEYENKHEYTIKEIERRIRNNERTLEESKGVIRVSAIIFFVCALATAFMWLVPGVRFIVYVWIPNITVDQLMVTIGGMTAVPGGFFGWVTFDCAREIERANERLPYWRKRLVAQIEKTDKKL